MLSIINLLFHLLVYLPEHDIAITGERETAISKAESAMPLPSPASRTIDYANADVASLLSIKTILERKVAAKGMLGFSKKGQLIEAWYFPGTSDKRALVIGGVHGSELSSIEVAKTLISQLQKSKPFYSVIVIPCLFPDNADAARSFSEVGGTHNTGRYSNTNAADPNRQMPSLGRSFRPGHPFDHLGREIEQENQLLLELITEFSPDRIANIHAIRDPAHAGIYADPRTDSKGIALGFESDSSLAVDMASLIHRLGGFVPGNQLNEQPTALYYKDPIAVPAGILQKRNTAGSNLPSNRGRGVSLGSWASTAVEDELHPRGNRPAVRLITIEFPGYKAPANYSTVLLQRNSDRQVQLYAVAIAEIFLGNHYSSKVEDRDVTRSEQVRQ